ncbi:hypothetical protein M513_10696 [Trichuris suis]|uniref:Uncharacterized protein n=1 Tax=Trichuris suis TaxID=68888 RepID=A0A085LU32_9BILA|nr:hypothetical protein M513_10696 [Trichuris suis]
MASERAVVVQMLAPLLNGATTRKTCGVLCLHQSQKSLILPRSVATADYHLFLRRKSNSFRYNDGLMQVQLTTMLQVVEQLRAAGIELSEGDQVAALLNSLLESYSRLVIALEGRG